MAGSPREGRKLGLGRRGAGRVRPPARIPRLRVRPDGRALAQAHPRGGGEPTDILRVQDGGVPWPLGETDAEPVADSGEVALHAGGDQSKAPPFVEVGRHVRQPVKVLEQLAKMLGPGSVGLAGFAWVLELDGRTWVLRYDQVDSVRHTFSAPLTLKVGAGTPWATKPLTVANRRTSSVTSRPKTRRSWTIRWCHRSGNTQETCGRRVRTPRHELVDADEGVLGSSSMS